MEIDWSEVKKITLWSYEELVEKILRVLSYSFVREHYNHSMREAEKYVDGLLGYDQKHADHVMKLARIFRKLDTLKIQSYAELIHRVENREKCEGFLRKAELPFRDFMSALNYLFRWILPFNIYLRELIDADNETHLGYLEQLRELGIRFNLDILERGRHIESRRRISEEKGIPETFVADLVNRADMTRLPYSNRKTVKHLCVAGYCSLGKIAQADLRDLKEHMRLHFDKTGVRFARSFIDLDGISRWARIVPRVVET